MKQRSNEVTMAAERGDSANYVCNFEEGLYDAVCGDAGGGSGAAADGESGADEFVAGDSGVSAGGVCGGGEASGVAEDAAKIVAADTEEE